MLDGWRAQSAAIRVLRAFLGLTFLYAGAQKLADPNFLHAGGVDYIGQQLRSFAEGSPISPLLHLAEHAPVLTGVAIALVEIAVGLGTLLGIAPVTAAAIGMAVNLVLFLSATWHVHPYFLGSDSVYAVAWLAYLVALLEARRRRAGLQSVDRPRRRTPADRADLRRREFLRGGVLAAASLFVAAAAKAVAGSPTTFTSPGRGSLASGGSTATTSPSAGAPATRGTPIASLDSVPVGSAIGFTAPGGFPAVLLRPAQNSVLAYSRVCTHAGCLVQFDPRNDILICPCHGAEFDPTKGAAVIAGPAPSPLRSIPVAIDHATGKVVVTA